MRKGYTLIELMVVVAIFLFLFAAILGVLATADRGWKIGQNKLIAQQEARRAMDQITRLLRQASPSWGVYIGNSYTGSNQSKIQFNIDTATTFIFKLDPARPHQLIMQDSRRGSAWFPVAQNITNLSFSGGDCPDCNCDITDPDWLNCTNVTNACPLVRIDITAEKDHQFSLVNYVTLRNFRVTGSTVPPAAGEF